MMPTQRLRHAEVMAKTPCIRMPDESGRSSPNPTVTWSSSFSTTSDISEEPLMMEQHNTPISPLLGLSAQIALLIPAVSEIEQQRSCDKAALERANTQRAERLKEAGQLRQKKYRDEVLAIVRAHQGLKTNEVAKLSHHERSLTLLLLKDLEVSKQVRNTGSAKVARWEAV